MTESGTSDCQHIWENHDGEPLACYQCGKAWPGHPLPEPFSARNEGYGDLHGFTPWDTRVGAMVGGLLDLDRSDNPPGAEAGRRESGHFVRGR